MLSLAWADPAGATASRLYIAVSSRSRLPRQRPWGFSTLTDIRDQATVGRLPVDLAKVWLGLAEDGALGYAIATLARSQLGGIGAGIAIYFGTQFGGLFLPDVVKYFPFSADSAMVGADLAGGGANGPGTSPLDPTSALLVVVAWHIGALVVAAAFTERAEIGG